MQIPSRAVHSNQDGLHPDLPDLLSRHRGQAFRKPIADHTRAAFDRFLVERQGDSRPLILDSGCGVGWSTHNLAERYPDTLVVGIDKSDLRLSKAHRTVCNSADNIKFFRADLVDFWRLLNRHNCRVARHYLLYPNPWPKKKDVQKRFHGHPIFFELVQLSSYLELRSNWELYVREFAFAIAYAAGRTFDVQEFVPDSFISPFEKKFHLSGQKLYRLIADFSRSEES
ncbi:methyltransferase domain-containing protein [candidate division KSB1 bacterium]|nr:methyltransferase domain-containing protein [candidate division KSB1 bacterium]